MAIFLFDYFKHHCSEHMCVFRCPTHLSISVGEFPGKGVAASKDINNLKAFGAFGPKVPEKGPRGRIAPSSVSMPTLGFLHFLQEIIFEVGEKVAKKVPLLGVVASSVLSTSYYFSFPFLPFPSLPFLPSFLSFSLFFSFF